MHPSTEEQKTEFHLLYSRHRIEIVTDQVVLRNNSANQTNSNGYTEPQVKPPHDARRNQTPLPANRK